MICLIQTLYNYTRAESFFPFFEVFDVFEAFVPERASLLAPFFLLLFFRRVQM